MRRILDITDLSIYSTFCSSWLTANLRSLYKTPAIKNFRYNGHLRWILWSSLSTLVKNFFDESREKGGYKLSKQIIPSFITRLFGSSWTAKFLHIFTASTHTTVGLLTNLERRRINRRNQIGQKFQASYHAHYTFTRSRRPIFAV